jgi:hypothetical protein
MMGAKRLQTQNKIEYVKPAIEELGPVTALLGDNCSDGGTVTDWCHDGGFPGFAQCDKGTIVSY